MKTLKLFALLLTLAFASCKSDLCQDISCLNGGTCLNGLCSCAVGYEGPACEKEKTPKSITILDVQLLKFPSTKPTGAGWDALPASGPDLYFTVTDLTTKTLIRPYPGTYVSNVTSGSLPFSFSSVPIKIVNVFNRFEISIYDWDQFPPDELVGGINFNIFSKGTNFPTKIKLECPLCDTSFELTVSYEF